MTGDITTDSFYNGRITIKQDRDGYRFSIDAVLLAGFVRPEKGNRIVDLGTGCGIIPLILTHSYPDIKVYGIEIQEQLAKLADLNIKANRMENQVAIVCSDMKDLKIDMISGTADIVVSNPPYRKADSGRINPDGQKAVARHEIKATLNDLIKTADRFLNISGKFFVVYPAERMVDMLTVMRLYGIEPKYIRMVHSKGHGQAKLILVKGIKGSRPGITTGSPLVIYQNNGKYTDEITGLYNYKMRDLIDFKTVNFTGLSVKAFG